MPLSRRTVLAGCAALPFAPAFAAPPVARIKRLDPALDAIIAPGTRIEQLASGFSWTEGPVWVKRGGYLLFSNLSEPSNTIYRWSRKDGVTAFLAPAGYDGPHDPALREPGSNGLTLDREGRLIICNTGGRSLDRYDLVSKTRTVLAARYDGKRFNSPNDVVVSRTGAIYFTDPPYGLEGLEHSPAKELDFSGLFRVAQDGSVTLLDKEFLYPNGLAFSPGEKTLYVCNTDEKSPIIRALKMGPDGLPASASTFFDFRPYYAKGVTGVPDGLKVDVHGNVFAAGPGGHFIISPAGKLLGLIETPGRYATNSAFGEDGSTLFIAATDLLLRLRLRTRGAQW